MVERTSEKALAIIPFTSLCQWVDEGGAVLDENIIYLMATPYRFKTTESEKSTELPYMKFYHRLDVALDLHYSREKFRAPFNSNRVIAVMSKEGIDDCQIQRIVLEFLDKNPPLIQSLVLAFTTKPVRATTDVGQHVMQKRASFLDKVYGKEMERIKLTQPRQLELVSAVRSGRKLPIGEQTDTKFLLEVQKRTHGIVLIKSMLPYEITKYRDGRILDGVFRR